jgi:hypothetical protein
MGQSRGCAFIQFEQKEAADAVLRACGFDLQKDPIAATLPINPSNQVHKKGLSFDSIQVLTNRYTKNDDGNNLFKINI